MATLGLSYQELYNDVSRFLGTYGSSGPTGTDLTDAQSAVHAGYRKFLDSNPVGWSFLKRTDEKITTVSNTYTYELPKDFVSLVGTFQFGADQTYGPLSEISVDMIRDWKAVNDYNSYPTHFAMTAGNYHAETGQTWNVLFYPTPDSAYTLHFAYRFYPPKLSNATDVPAGPLDVAECIRQCCLAEAETYLDENTGIQETKAKELMLIAIRNDLKRQPKTLGYYGNRVTSSLTRGDYRTENVVYNT